MNIGAQVGRGDDLLSVCNLTMLYFTILEEIVLYTVS